MKKIYTIAMLIFLSVGTAYADSHTCTTQWIQQDGKKYKAPKNLTTVDVSFVNELDGIKFKTQNRTSYYVYKSFLDIDGRLGISYNADNGNLLDLFQDGMLVIWQGNTPLLRAECPTMKLKISKIN